MPAQGREQEKRYELWWAVRWQSSKGGIKTHVKGHQTAEYQEINDLEAVRIARHRNVKMGDIRVTLMKRKLKPHKFINSFSNLFLSSSLNSNTLSEQSTLLPEVTGFQNKIPVLSQRQFPQISILYAITLLLGTKSPHILDTRYRKRKKEFPEIFRHGVKIHRFEAL